MSEIKALRHEAYISDVVLREILAAPESLLTKMMHEVKDLERLKSSMESERLASVYLQHKIFPAKSMDDARHVAIATISNMDAVVSWNFGHLVNIVKIKKVNTINEMMGYKHMEIVTPQEVVNAKD
ncbi:MAG: hypothetical protein HYS07_10795 [Chlamydiae bacterium]|nr:hypothetical protein [Chlamydiota bacterium]MBI3276871.1 hypothetical protein [Chlamydiota bacterium]